MTNTTFELPSDYKNIQHESEKIHFSMPSDLHTGCLLRTLVASKPGGKFLELGTGTGLSLSWMAEALDENSTVTSIDNNEEYQRIAKKFFDNDKRVSIICEDGKAWIQRNQQARFDLIFADAWPGKYDATDETLALVAPGGFYVLDDMLPQPNWPEGHDKNVATLIAYLEKRKDFQLTKLNWSTGIIIMTKKV